MFFIVKFMVFVSLQHCKGQSYNNEVLDVFLPAVHRILKHNMVSFTPLWLLIYKGVMFWLLWVVNGQNIFAVSEGNIHYWMCEDNFETL